MKKNIKKIFNLIIIINIILSFTSVYALGTSIKNGADSFIGIATSNDYNAIISPTITQIANIVMGIGVIVLIITGLIIAMKTMSDGATGKAQLKESLTPYFIGCIVIIAAWTIWKIVVQILQ